MNRVYIAKFFLCFGPMCTINTASKTWDSEDKTLLHLIVEGLDQKSSQMTTVITRNLLNCFFLILVISSSPL